MLKIFRNQSKINAARLARTAETKKWRKSWPNNSLKYKSETSETLVKGEN
jgi:hypothetical protein